jgi:hypothetical protein
MGHDPEYQEFPLRWFDSNTVTCLELGDSLGEETCVHLVCWTIEVNLSDYRYIFRNVITGITTNIVNLLNCFK